MNCLQCRGLSDPVANLTFNLVLVCVNPGDSEKVKVKVKALSKHDLYPLCGIMVIIFWQYYHRELKMCVILLKGYL